jgi:hypothetical protein
VVGGVLRTHDRVQDLLHEPDVTYR